MNQRSTLTKDQAIKIAFRHAQAAVAGAPPLRDGATKEALVRDLAVAQIRVFCRRGLLSRDDLAPTVQEVQRQFPVEAPHDFREVGETIAIADVGPSSNIEAGGSFRMFKERLPEVKISETSVELLVGELEKH